MCLVNNKSIRYLKGPDAAAERAGADVISCCKQVMGGETGAGMGAITNTEDAQGAAVEMITAFNY